jgi:hypothetical protein
MKHEVTASSCVSHRSFLSLCYVQVCERKRWQILLAYVDVFIIVAFNIRDLPLLRLLDRCCFAKQHYSYIRSDFGLQTSHCFKRHLIRLDACIY